MDNARAYTQTSTGLTTTPATVLTENRSRKVALFFNTGTTELLIGIGTALIPIAAGDHKAFADGLAPINAITAKVAAGTGTLVVWEA